MPEWEIVESGTAALLWAAVFLWGGRARSMYAMAFDSRAVASFGAGMAVAYVFVNMMPELHLVRGTLVASISTPLPYEGKSTYFLALVGFLTFYGLRYLRGDEHETAGEDRTGPGFWLHISSFAAYVWLLGYLLVNGLQETETSIALYAMAMAVHFLAVDRALGDEHGAIYQRIGRMLLAAMSMAGWGAGMLFALPQHVVALLVAFLSGAIIMNSTAMELRSATEGRFWPMMAGGTLYGLILLPLG
jgi:hypothetical protein